MKTIAKRIFLLALIGALITLGGAMPFIISHIEERSLPMRLVERDSNTVAFVSENDMVWFKLMMVPDLMESESMLDNVLEENTAPDDEMLDSLLEFLHLIAPDTGWDNPSLSFKTVMFIAYADSGGVFPCTCITMYDSTNTYGCEAIIDNKSGKVLSLAGSIRKDNNEYYYSISTDEAELLFDRCSLYDGFQFNTPVSIYPTDADVGNNIQ